MLKLRPTCENCNKELQRDDNYLGKYPPSTKVKHRPVDPEAHKQFASKIMKIAPNER